MVITDRRFGTSSTILQDAASGATTARAPTGAKVSIEYVQITHLKQLAERMRSTVHTLERLEGARKAIVFTEDDLRTLHRIRTGIQLRNPEVAAKWANELHTEALPDYLSLLFVGFHFSLREDALGEIAAGRPSSALWIFRESLGCIAAGLLASVGQTNPNNKWRVRLLEQNAAQVGEQPTACLLDLLLRDHPSSSEVPEYIRRRVLDCDALVMRIIEQRPSIAPTLMKLQSEASFRTHL
jgi:hypothetical protein